MVRATTFVVFLLSWAAAALGDTPPARVQNSLTYDAASNPITSTVSGAKRGLDCNVSNALTAPASSQTIVGGAAIDPRSIRALTTADQVSCGQLGTWNVANITGTVSLPTNAAQESGGNLAATATSTAAINGKMSAFDLDSGAGTQTVQGVSLRLAASGGSVEAGTAANPLRLDPTGTTTQPISAAALPLPSGASTSALQTAGNASLASIDGKLNNTTGGALKTDSSAFTQPISAASLPLPAGAATAANQTTSNTTLSAISSKLFQNGTADATKVDGSSFTQPISGAVTVSGSVASTQSGTWSTRTQDGAGNAISSQVSGSLRPLDVGVVVGGVTVDPRATRALTSGGDSISAVQSGTWNVGNITGTVTLPTGAATAALQTSGNSILTTIDGKTPTLGQKTMAGSSPVTIASDQTPIPITGSISVSTASVGSIASNVPTSGDFIAGKDPAGKLQGFLIDNGGSLQVAGEGIAGTPAGGVVSVQGVAGGTALPASQSGAWSITNITGTVSLPTGASTSALQTTGNASLSSIDTKMPALVSGRVPVDGSGVTQPVSGTVAATQSGGWTVTSNIGTTGGLALDATLGKLTIAQGAATGANTGALVQGVATTAAPTYTTATINPLSLTTAGALRTDASGSTQPVSGTVTANAGSGTFAISAAALPLPAGASTAAKQPALGTAGTPSADVLTVQGAASMTPLKTDGSATTQPISAAALPLPSGASTAALQTAGNSSLSSIDTKTPALVSGRVPVDGSGVTQPVSGTVTANQGGAPWSVTGSGTAGTPAAGVVTVQGAASMTAIKTDGSATTQPVSGTVAATQSGAWNITNITGTVSLPTGASTLAAQTTGNASLSSLDGKTPTLGQKTSANSSPTVIASDQSTLPVAVPDATNTGTLTALNQAVTVGPFNGLSSWSASISGTFSAGSTLTWEVSDDNVNWIAVNGRRTGTGTGTSILGTSVNGGGGSVFYRGNAGGVGYFRVRASAFQSGDSIAVVAKVGGGVGAVFLNSALPPGNNTIGNVGFAQGSQAIYGPLITAGRINQLSVPFFTGAVSNLVSVATSGTGTNNITSSGYAQFSTGTGTTAQSTAQTNVTTSYIVGDEIFVAVSAAFTAPTSAASFQKIGLYDANNGFYVGYIGTTFNVCVRNQGVDTCTPQGSWSDDQLTGSLYASSFTRNKVAEAINFSNLNLYRIRFGWYGAAPAYFEVYSPDGQWVLLHQIRQPNTSAIPSIANPNLPVTCEVIKTASDATNLTISTGAWAAGATNQGPADNYQVANITSTQAVSTTLLNYSSASIQVNGTWTGTLIPQTSQDGVNWNTVEVYPPSSTGTETTLTSITANGTYEFVDVAGMGYARVLGAVASGTAIASVRGSSSMFNRSVSQRQNGLSQPSYGQQISASDGVNSRFVAADTAGHLVITKVDGYKATYSAAINGYALPAAATDSFTITGSATKTVKVTDVHISCTQTTGSYTELVMLRRSTANTAGTSTTPTVVPLDSSDAAATASARAYTANPTLGTLVGSLRGEKFGVSTVAMQVAGGNSAPVSNTDHFDWSSGINNGKAITLRGTSQVLSINFNGSTLAGGNCSAWAEWTEE